MPAAKKKSTAKKASVKRAPSKSSSRTTVRRVRPTRVEDRSFRVSKQKEPFMSARFTEQTFYWVVLCALVLGLAIWVLTISVKVQTIYDEIDRQNTEADSIVVPAKS